MWPFKKENRAEEWADISEEDVLLRSALKGSSVLGREEVLNIPAVSACVNKICDTVGMMPFKLYRIDGDEMKAEEVPDDPRVAMLNVDPGDTLDAVQLKRMITRDYLLDKGGYVYIERAGNKVKSLRYVDPGYVGFNYNAHPIFKEYNILVEGQSYQPYQFLKVLRNSRDGMQGTSMQEENRLPFLVAYKTMEYRKRLVDTGGAKKGFVKAPKRLDSDAIKLLKAAWTRLFASGTENVVILNDGMEFQEASETSTEMQINESTNSDTKLICEIFGVPVQLINREVGTASEEDRIVFIQYCIAPILSAIENALNRDLLLESEKGRYKFQADTSEFTKADIMKRYQAYEIASKNGFMQTDEIRYRENMPPMGLDFVKLGLQDVLYYPDSKMTFMPNMNQVGGIELAMEDRETKKRQTELELRKAEKELGEDAKQEKETETKKDTDPGKGEGDED